MRTGCRILCALAVINVPTFARSHVPRLLAQSSRLWNPEDRAFVTDLSVVTAVAVTRNIIYAATPNGLAVYDRGMRKWKQTVGPLDGFPRGSVTAMVADPNDDTAWLGGQGAWMSYDPFTRRMETGSLPGTTDQVILDARSPGRGAWFHTTAGWYEVPKGGLVAAPGTPPATRVGGLTGRDLITRLPAFDAVRMRIERDDQLRTYQMTAAAQTPVTNEIVVGTNGNGAFQVDPVSYGTDQLPMGLLGASTGAITVARGQVCAASNARIQSARRGITCFDEGLGRFSYLESAGLTTLPGGNVRRILVTERSIWLATDQGLVRAPRRGGRPVQLLARDGLPDDQIYGLAAAPEGAYVGTLHGMALVSDTGRALVVEAKAGGLAVLSIANPTSDTIWAGTSAGVVGFPLPIGGPVVIPVGSAEQREPVFAIAMRGDTILASTATHLLIRQHGLWRVVDPPGTPVGQIAAISAGETGFFIAGDRGFAWYDPVRPLWNALIQPGDVAPPVHDIAATRDYIWIATDIGVFRYEKRVVVP
ncbi:MAG TPA: hypothetical protein VGI92_01025 [Gemmatimonadales bacterium]|jgi:ligand-binding sensor domain-containing protein